MPSGRFSGCAIPLLVAGTALVLLGSAAALGADLFTAAIVAAALPLPLYLAVALSVDQFEPEPRRLLALAFLWGASVAILASSILNGITDSALGEAASTVMGAPVSEEVLKAVVLVYLFARRKDEFDGVVDGVVYAAMVGLGFAFAENVDYYGRALQTEGLEGLAVVVTLRGVISPYSHPLFTGMTGIGLGLARESSRPWVKRVAPAAGLGMAILLHALWNAGAQAGVVFFAVYAFIMLPAFGALLGVVAWSLKREGRVLKQHLRQDVECGAISEAAYEEACSVRRRLRASLGALVREGPRGRRELRRRHQAAAELALLRRRVERGLQPAEPALERQYLSVLAPGFVPPPLEAPPAPPDPPLAPADQPPPPVA